MIGKAQAKKITNLVFKASRADQVEVLFYGYNQALTRFANNYIHQNVNESNVSVGIRSIFGKKIGSASTNSLDPKRIQETVAWSERIASFQRDNPDFQTLPDIKPSVYRPTSGYVKATAGFSNNERARAVAEIIAVAQKNSLTAFGSVSNGAAEILAANNHGTFAYDRTCDIFCNIVMTGATSSGYVQAGSRYADKINFKKVALAAASKALAAADPMTLEPGPYTTIFEPLAVQDIFSFLGYYGFNGKMFEEGRSFLSGKLGSKVFDPKITITDDPFNRRGFTAGFDFEGVPKRKLVLVDRGVAVNVAYDSMTAARAKKTNTGHAMPAPNPFGPVPTHMILKGGTETLEEMIRNTPRGILVTRLHYTNVIDPFKMIITGMTRDGTFLIENGAITKAVKNFRFTENIVEALNRVEAVGRVPELVPFEPGYGARYGRGMFVPPLKIKDFTFTSATEF